MNEEQVVDFAPEGHRVDVWEGYGDIRPLGLYAARNTAAQVRKIRLRRLKP